jgi:hypothetical protein
MMARIALVLVATLALAGAAPSVCAQPDSGRFALLVGSNLGDRGDPVLRHAESDATRLAQTLRLMGGFPADQVVLITGATASEMHDALIQLNARVREHKNAVLVVFYSGHADEQSLHLSATRLATAELKALLVGSPAASPASELVECESGGFTCDLVAPETGIVVRRFFSPSLGYQVSGDLEFHWGTNDEPVLLAAPVLWWPQQTVRIPEPASAVEGDLDFGLILQDLSSNSGQVQVLPPEAGLTIYGTSTAGTTLVWARKCLGLYETVCSYYLHRITLPGGADQIVAVGDSAAPVAITVSGHRFAIAALDGIHIGDLP